MSQKIVRELLRYNRNIFTGRLYGKIFREKIEQTIKDKIGEDLASFTAGRSCKDHIYILEQLLERKKA